MVQFPIKHDEMFEIGLEKSVLNASFILFKAHLHAPSKPIARALTAPG